MKIAVLSFTSKGCNLNKKILEFLRKEDIKATGFTLSKFAENNNLNSLEPSLREWTLENFNKYDALCFIGALGIAVRTIAPFIKSKDIDPAVLVIDEKGEFIIPLLSGHIGGANKLSIKIAEYLKGKAVITTATDINNEFAVDNFAVSNNLIIDNIKDIKVISGRILEGKNVGLYSDLKLLGELPRKIVLDEEDFGICISYKDIKPFKFTMNLIPKNLSLGIGCRKNKPLEDIESLVFSVLKENNISIKAIKGIYSIDLKKNEQGILDFSKKYNIPFKVFTAEELKKAKGDFSKSAFVSSVTGVDNVCERAAISGSLGGEIYIKKTSNNGVTASIAKEEWSVKFE